MLNVGPCVLICGVLLLVLPRRRLWDVVHSRYSKILNTARIKFLSGWWIWGLEASLQLLSSEIYFGVSGSQPLMSLYGTGGNSWVWLPGERKHRDMAVGGDCPFPLPVHLEISDWPRFLKGIKKPLTIKEKTIITSTELRTKDSLERWHFQYTDFAVILHTCKKMTKS